MTVLLDFAFGHDEIAKSSRTWRKSQICYLKDQQQVIEKLRKISLVHPRGLQVAIHNKSLNKTLKKNKLLPCGARSLSILELWGRHVQGQPLR